MIPKKIFFTKGVGNHFDKLQSFELALRDAGIEKFNLVKVSSIIPPECEEISLSDALKLLKPGQIIYTVISKASSNELDKLLSASIGVARLVNNNSYGYLSEYQAFGIESRKAGMIAEDLAASMLGTTWGIRFNQDLDYDEKIKIFKEKGKAIKTKSITATATVVVENEWTTVIAAAIFIL